jgi:membrane protease YdiL (CAAX protease family)
MKKERALEIKSLLLVYGALIILSGGLDYFSHRHPLWAWRESHLSQAFFVVVGILFVVFYIGIATLSGRIFRWAAELEKLFAQVLTPLSYLHIVVLALLSGFVEEWFFRGVLLNHFGLMISSIVFGLAHFLPDRMLWRWSIISFIAGLILGMLYISSHSLWLVATLHATINGVLLFKLNHERDQAPSLT